MPPPARPLLDVGELDSLGLRPLPDLHAIEDDALAGARIAAQLLARLLEGEALDRIGLVPVAQGGAERLHVLGAAAHPGVRLGVGDDADGAVVRQPEVEADHVILVGLRRQGPVEQHAGAQVVE
jgi:hypothetical protein